LARWIEEFQSWDLDIRYRRGSEAVVPDALSRRPDYNPLRLNILRGELAPNDYTIFMEDYLEKGILPKNEFDELICKEAPNFVLKEGQVYRKIKDGVIAPCLEWEFRGDLIQRMHNEYGHLSLAGMRDLVERRGWWPKMDKDIHEFIQSCPNCQVAQRQRINQEREYGQLPTSRNVQPFQRWGIDLIGRLPKTKSGNQWIITAIDYATGWPLARALPRATEDEIAEFIFKDIYMNFGAPVEIFTDGGKNLWGSVVQKYLEKIKTKHKGTSPFHPRTNGKVESLNGLIGNMLTKYLFGKPTRLWDIYLDQALFACRIRTQATTKMSPFYLVYGQQPRLVGDDSYTFDAEAPPEDYISRLEQLQSARQDAVERTYKRAVQAKEAKDEIVQPHDIDTGDWVLVRHEDPHKFESKWFGPYQVVEKMLLGTYRLQDPNGRELASLVHGNRLLKARINSTDELRKLWAAPATKDQLRRQNLNPELIISDDPKSSDLLEQYLLQAEDALLADIDNTDELLQSEKEPIIHDTIIVQPRPQIDSRKRTSTSSTPLAGPKRKRYR
jgi:hypothetical protein